MSGLACMYSCFYRSRMRNQYMLAETPYPDWCLHLCCEVCALCQEYRELKNRGFNMNIGTLLIYIFKPSFHSIKYYHLMYLHFSLHYLILYRMACEHGEYAKSCYANVDASGGGRWDETINNDDSLS